jgi:hypothetical protein
MQEEKNSEDTEAIAVDPSSSLFPPETKVLQRR